MRWRMIRLARIKVVRNRSITAFGCGLCLWVRSYCMCIRLGKTGVGKLDMTGDSMYVCYGLRD